MKNSFTGQIEVEYDIDDKNNKTILGKGTYGVVYAARDKYTQIKVSPPFIYPNSILRVLFSLKKLMDN